MAVRKWNWLLAVALGLAVVPPGAAQEFFLKKGDVVVVMGDSITEQRLYSNYLEIWCLTRYPSWGLVFRNVGIGGDRSTGGNARFERDVLSHKPTVLTVDFGMNDGNYNLKAFDDKAFAVYMKGLQGIADKAKAADLRVAWITPQPVEYRPGDPKEAYNKTLEKFSEGLKQIAKTNGGLFVDQFHPYGAVIQKARAAGEKGRITGGDAVHPGPPGQALMAASILRAMHWRPDVSQVSIDLKAGRHVGQHADIADLTGGPGGVSFQRTDHSLPFFPREARGILKWAPLLEDMNRYVLQVVGLKAGRYDVKLGGTRVATYSADELAKGVNLAGAALAAGPVADQVRDVVKAVSDKTNYYHDQIYSPLVLRRNLARNPDFKGVAKADIDKRRRALIEERMKRMPELDAVIRKALKPRSHLVEVVPAK
jgi:lysophospholipase L1-like esterase